MTVIDRFVTLAGITETSEGSSGSITRIDWTDSTNPGVVTDAQVVSGPDGLLDAGIDSWSGEGNVFTGLTIDFNGETYAIFRSTAFGSYFIPYDSSRGDIAALADRPNFSTGYTPTGAQVFNCFARGTRIATPDGERIVETLKPGDLVLTHDGRSTPAIWVARQTVANPRGVELGRKPVRIDAGALGPGLPNRPLTVTGDHALLFGDMLVNAGTLVNGTTIRLLPLSEMPTKFVWWHVELENHECVVANGVPAESFIDYVGRSGFDNYDEYLALAGADRLIKEMPFVRISAHRLVPPGLREALGIEPPSYMPRRKAA